MLRYMPISLLALTLTMNVSSMWYYIPQYQLLAVKQNPHPLTELVVAVNSVGRQSYYLNELLQNSEKLPLDEYRGKQTSYTPCKTIKKLSLHHADG
jgi:hypothetical protein